MATTQIAYRTLKGIGVFNTAPVYEPLPGFQRPEGNLRCCTYSPCGRYFAWADQSTVKIINADTSAVVTTLPTENVFEIGFSPLGTYAITWQRPSKDETTGDAVKNLKVWRVDEDTTDQEKETVGRFVQKSQTGWNLQYTFDERYCARVVTNEVQIYESHDLTKVWSKLRAEGVTDFALSPGKNHNLAVFIPERKGQPAAVRVYNVPNFGSPASQKNFFKGDKVQLQWNDAGTSLIVLASTDVDKSNKSYYGETTMYLLSANGGFDSRIDLDKEGPIHDVSWSPKSNSFVVVYGYMPAKTVIFNARAQPIHTFPLSPRNTVKFSPHGRYLLVAGFGNLAGQTDIYDMDKDYKKICTIEAANASVCEWAPDGKHILTATTSPRLRVDNGVRIWHVAGQLMYNEDMNELYHVCWRPQPLEMHPLIGDQPHLTVPAPHSSATDYMATRKTPSKPVGAYRPPGARGTSTPLSFKREDEGGAAFVRDSAPAFASNVNGFGKPRPRVVPGAEPALPPGAAPGGGVSLTGTGEGADQPLSKSAKKNAKKREAKKAAAEAATQENGLAPDAANGRAKSPNRVRSRSKGAYQNNLGPDVPTGPRNNRSRSSSRRNTQTNGSGTRPNTSHGQKQKLSVDPSPTQTPAETPSIDVTSPTTPGSNNANEKKIRGLLKKIRAIDDLKMRLAANERLEDTQMKKISSEESVRKELAELGFTGNA